MASDIKQVSGSLAAASGTVGQISYANGFVSLYVAGTFVGTLQVQAQSNYAPNGFVPMTPIGATSPNITAPGLYVFPHIPGDFAYEVEMTAFTSGTANVVLSACPTV